MGIFTIYGVAKTELYVHIIMIMCMGLVGMHFSAQWNFGNKTTNGQNQNGL